MPPEFFFGHAFNQDPYAQHAALRDKGPIHPIEFPKGPVGSQDGHGR
jgi:hypothetical protein